MRKYHQAEADCTSPQWQAFVRFIGDNWDTLGYTPMIIHLLVRKGWYDEMIDDLFTLMVGQDYADVKLTVWVERLEKNWRIEFPDGKPVFQILNELLIEHYGEYRSWN
jgi:hypothetical protein